VGAVVGGGKREKGGFTEEENFVGGRVTPEREEIKRKMVGGDGPGEGRTPR